MHHRVQRTHDWLQEGHQQCILARLLLNTGRWGTAACGEAATDTAFPFPDRDC